MKATRLDAQQEINYFPTKCCPLSSPHMAIIGRKSTSTKLSNRFCVLRPQTQALRKTSYCVEVMCKSLKKLRLKFAQHYSDIVTRCDMCSTSLMVISFLQRRCHPVTWCIKKIADQPCYNVIFYFRRTEHKC